MTASTHDDSPAVAPSLLADAVAFHQQALAAREAMQAAARDRDVAVAAAVAAGVSSAELAAGMGVNKQRVSAMRLHGAELMD